MADIRDKTKIEMQFKGVDVVFLMGERLMTAANSNQNGECPIFASTRFGNVLRSRGSVISIFREQIRAGYPVYNYNE